MRFFVEEPTFARYGVNNEFPVNVILLQPTTSHETFIEGSDYVDFESTSKLRNWPISVGDKIFFVDPVIFSRNSDYFKILINNKFFLEGSIGLLKIIDETPKDVLTLITAISPNGLGLYPDAIDERNVCTILRLCDKYLMTNLKRNCIDYLKEYEPETQPITEVFSLFYQLCFSLNAEYDHDADLTDVAIETMFSCLVELVDPANTSQFYRHLAQLCNKNNANEGSNAKRVADAVIHGGALFKHRISFREEVQGLGCHQCSMRPPMRQFRSKNKKPFVLSLCKSCGHEVCANCRRKPCQRLFEEWINELRS